MKNLKSVDLNVKWKNYFYSELEIEKDMKFFKFDKLILKWTCFCDLYGVTPHQPLTSVANKKFLLRILLYMHCNAITYNFKRIYV